MFLVPHFRFHLAHYCLSGATNGQNDVTDMNKNHGSDWFKCLCVIESCLPDMQLNYVFFTGWACEREGIQCRLCVHVYVLATEKGRGMKSAEVSRAFTS